MNRKLSDIRAPKQFQFFHITNWNWHESLLLFLSDIFALASAWQLARFLNKFYSPIPEKLVWWVWFSIPSLFWVFLGLILLFFAYGGLYHSATQGQNYVKTGQLVSLVYLLSLVLNYFYDPTLDPPRSLFFTAWFFSIVFVLGIRLILALILRQFEPSSVSVFLIAPAGKLHQLAQLIQSRSHYKIVGATFSNMAHFPITLKQIFDSGAVEVLVEDLPPTNLASHLYWQLRKAGISLRLIPASRDILYHRGVPEIFAGLPTLRLETPLFLGWDYRLKRWLDVIGSLIGIILLSPFFIVIALLIKLSSPGPVFFKQERMGLHGKVFHMWKFRTMIVNAEKLQSELESQNQSQDGVLFKIKNDPRIIPCGKFLRRTSIDELPQLFNVLIGQMSLVGPRPLPLRDIQRFDPWHHIRHQVVPGITGLWQISGRSDLDSFDDTAKLDLYYIDNWSLNLDFDILIDTIRIVLFGKGAY